jgi:hypothetical protein
MTTQWTADRREEMSLMLDLIHTMKHINKGSGFMQAVQSCIDIAKQLDETDLRAGRISFSQFVIGIAAGDE